MLSKEKKSLKIPSSHPRKKPKAHKKINFISKSHFVIQIFSHSIPFFSYFIHLPRKIHSTYFRSVHKIHEIIRLIHIHTHCTYMADVLWVAKLWTLWMMMMMKKILIVRVYRHRILDLWSDRKFSFCLLFAGENGKWIVAATGGGKID